MGAGRPRQLGLSNQLKPICTPTNHSNTYIITCFFKFQLYRRNKKERLLGALFTGLE